ncbi:MFS transporter [Bacillus sp. MUM 13]|uniref:MFS transporter n=1 Tax=Bacillus sp. MUM 13 TaxID=1678001 RepID=UPI0008F5DE0A|nr:MFS transporter [Bacillus sp. MUM 13]OIK12699.1 MFS transporter [Bacillus sp. MUM 13]
MEDTHFSYKTLSRELYFPKFLVIAILTIFSIGPQYFLNLSFTINQIIIQNGFMASSDDMLYPSILSNLAFAIGVPLGPAFSRKFGLKQSYLTLIIVFLFGSVINLFSIGLDLFDLGRIIQGFSAGLLFLTILPVSLRSFPNKIRNTFLFMAIAGLFGSSAVGAYFGSISLRLDAWRWLFVLNVISALLCLIVGMLLLPRDKKESLDKRAFDKRGAVLLIATAACLSVPMINLQKLGFKSGLVWPFLAAAAVFLILFIWLDTTLENPLVPFRTLFAAKPFFGFMMAIVSHIAFIVSLAGVNGFLRNILDTAFISLSHVYLSLFLGVVVSALICTFFYDKLGAGILGIIGSLAIIYVSFEWLTVNEDASLTTLCLQFGTLGAGISMALVSGALGTALAGDIHKASMRSVSLHFTRNMLGAIAAPILGWFLAMRNTFHYEQLRNQLSFASQDFPIQMNDLIRKFTGTGMSAADAKSKVTAIIAGNAQKSALMDTYHDSFMILLVLGIIILAASIGKVATGKGRSLVQKAAPVTADEKPPVTLLLNTPDKHK